MKGQLGLADPHVRRPFRALGSLLLLGLERHWAKKRQRQAGNQAVYQFLLPAIGLPKSGAPKTWGRWKSWRSKEGCFASGRLKLAQATVMWAESNKLLPHRHAKRYQEAFELFVNLGDLVAADFDDVLLALDAVDQLVFDVSKLNYTNTPDVFEDLAGKARVTLRNSNGRISAATAPIAPGRAAEIEAAYEALTSLGELRQALQTAFDIQELGAVANNPSREVRERAFEELIREGEGLVERLLLVCEKMYGRGPNARQQARRVFKRLAERMKARSP